MHCNVSTCCGNLAPNWEAAIQKRKILPGAFTQMALVSFLAAAPAPDPVVELKPEAVRGFDRYVQLTEQRMKPELAPGGNFLWVDGLPELGRAEIYSRLQRGEVVSAKLETSDSTGGSRTPGALIHHWIGTVFIPGATLTQVLAVVEDYDRHAEYYKPEVAQSKTIAHSGDNYKIRYRLRKKKIITIILDTDYDVHRHSLSATRAYSDSYSNRIAQVEHAGEPGEQELPPGNDGGYLWRLNSYWRYFDSGRGVYVQCEAVSLTRDIPSGLGWLIRPFIESVPKESLEFTLQSTRAAVLHVGRR